LVLEERETRGGGSYVEKNRYCNVCLVGEERGGGLKKGVLPQFSNERKV